MTNQDRWKAHQMQLGLTDDEAFAIWVLITAVEDAYQQERSLEASVPVVDLFRTPNADAESDCLPAWLTQLLNKSYALSRDSGGRSERVEFMLLAEWSVSGGGDGSAWLDFRVSPLVMRYFGVELY